MPKRADLKRILVIGSGPIVIGQGCEFDYSGTQACKALKAEGLEVVIQSGRGSSDVVTKLGTGAALFCEFFCFRRFALICVPFR